MQIEPVITTSEGVEGLSPGSTAWSVSLHITNTLRERGRSDVYIKGMSAKDIFSEYCTWNGLINWSNTLWDVVSVLKAIQKNGTNQPVKDCEAKHLENLHSTDEEMVRINKVAMAVFDACQRAVSKDHSLDNVNLSDIVYHALKG